MFDCASTEALKPLEGIIGQERAISALKFGLNITKPGFNIYVSGPAGTGRTTAIKAFLEAVASEKAPPPEPEAPPQQEYGDVMAQLRAELGEPAPEAPAQEVQSAALGGGGAGPGRPVSPEVARWLRDARIAVRRNWTLTGNFRMQSLTAVVEVKLDAAGHVKGTPQVARRSGNPWYDDGVVRSIQKASPLPAPPEAGTWTFVFTSDEDF